MPELMRLDGSPSPQGVTTIATPLVSLLLDMALGGDRDRKAALCTAHGIDPAVLAEPDGRLPARAVEQLVSQLARQQPEPRLGFKALELASPSVFQVVGFAMMSCPTLLEAMRCLARCLPILNDSATAQITREAGGYRLSLKAADPPPPLLQDTELAALLGFCRFITGGTPLRVIEASFHYDEPADLSAHRALLGAARLRFGQTVVSLLLDAHQLEQPLASTSPALRVLHRQLARLQLDDVRHHRLTSIEVRQHIIDQLEGRAPTLQSVARAMGRSPRHVQRALTMEGASFTALLDDTRRGLAHLYLQHSTLPLKELAFQLGFGEQSSLHRACARWFGQTPQRYRQAAGANPPRRPPRRRI